MAKNTKYNNNKALSMLLSAIAMLVITIIISFAASNIYNSILLKVYSLISVVDLLILSLLYQASKKSINTPDLIFNFGFGKHENLAVVISSIILPIIFMHFVYSSAYSVIYSDIAIHNLILIIISAFIALLSKVKEYCINSFYSNSNLLLFKNLMRNKTKSGVNLEILIFAAVTFMTLIQNKIGLNIIYSDIAFSAVIMLYLMYLPLKSLKNAVSQLLDKTLPEEILFDFLSVIIEHFNYMCEYKSMRTRRSGDDIFVDIDIVMPNDIALEKVNHLENSIKSKLCEKYPNAHPRVYAQPCAKNCIYKNNGSCPILSDNYLKDTSNV